MTGFSQCQPYPVELSLQISNPEGFPGVDAGYVTRLYKVRGNSDSFIVKQWDGVAHLENFRHGQFDLNDSLRLEILPRHAVQRHDLTGAQLNNQGYHVTMPLFSMGLSKFQEWAGTTAVYAKAQYPSVDMSFYFTNAITLGQQVKPNTMPCFRVEVKNKQLPIDPPRAEKLPPYQDRIVGAVSFHRLKWVLQQEGVFDAKIDGEVYPSPKDEDHETCFGEPPALVRNSNEPVTTQVFPSPGNENVNSSSVAPVSDSEGTQVMAAVTEANPMNIMTVAS